MPIIILNLLVNVAVFIISYITGTYWLTTISFVSIAINAYVIAVIRASKDFHKEVPLFYFAPNTKQQHFVTFEIGTHYVLPMYKIVDNVGPTVTGEGLHIHFVRGSKLNGENVPKREGVMNETLLAMIIKDLTYKHSILPSENTASAIEHLCNALECIEKRQSIRKEQGKDATYQ